MVYGPRDDAELDVVVQIIEEALDFARGPAAAHPWDDPHPGTYR